MIKREEGFTLIELAMVVLVLGLVTAIAAGGFGRYSDHYALNGATGNIAERVRFTRERAMATRTSQTVRFEAGYQGTDYRVEVGGVMQAGWALPKRITYTWLTGTIASVTLSPDGRASTSGLVILQDARGFKDTVSVLSSGLVLTQ